MIKLETQKAVPPAARAEQLFGFRLFPRPLTYNPVERCWAALENYWNGTVLDSIETALQWAAHMSWKGIAPVVHLLDSLYHKGIKVPLPELEQLYLPFWQRSETLPKWDITVYPI